MLIHPNYFLSHYIRIKPSMLIVDVTEKCNLNCKYCSYPHIYSRNSNNKELTAEEIICFLSILKENLFKPYISITGGEPFLKKDLQKILEYIDYFKFPWGLITNGTIHNEKIIRFLKKANPEIIRISLDGREETHDYLRGKGNFKRTIEFIKMITESFKRIRIVCVVTGVNIEDMEYVYNLASKLGCEVHFSLVSFACREEIDECERNIYSFFQVKEVCGRITLKPKKLLSFDVNLFIDKVRKLISLNRTRLIITPFLNQKELENYFGTAFQYFPKRKCYFPWFGLRIDPYGNVHPCRVLNMPLGNILTNNLIEVFNSKDIKRFRNYFKNNLLDICRRCAYLNGQSNSFSLVERLKNKYF